jgi:hypothetical protein
MTNKFELHIAQTDILKFEGEKGEKEIILHLTMETDEMEDGQPFVNAINQTLYEGNLAREWLIDAEYKEQHKAENSIVESLVLISASIDVTKDILIPLAISLASPLLTALANQLFKERASAISLSKAEEKVREYLENSKATNWHSSDYEIIGNNLLIANKERIQKREKISYIIYVYRKSINQYYEIHVGGKGNIILRLPISKDKLP